MTGRQFAGLLALLGVAVVASYALEPGLAVVVLIGGAFLVAVGDHRLTERLGREHDRAQRLAASARRHEHGKGDAWGN